MCELRHGMLSVSMSLGERLSICIQLYRTLSYANQSKKLYMAEKGRAQRKSFYVTFRLFSFISTYSTDHPFLKSSNGPDTTSLMIRELEVVGFVDHSICHASTPSSGWKNCPLRQYLKFSWIGKH
ncbi:hypothetical protein RF11_05976 [Thelohanellus kitauei]|uniref:Uncharacterized protein n=1 Tax=Thelohanellus kitauei TaxID=669202 RepID=A0A0C2II26_THEKT|nr:hypothetical protein RF11_05976 [Thelohanellus kitauei]